MERCVFPQIKPNKVWKYLKFFSNKEVKVLRKLDVFMLVCSLLISACGSGGPCEVVEVNGVKQCQSPSAQVSVVTEIPVSPAPTAVVQLPVPTSVVPIQSGIEVVDQNWSLPMAGDPPGFFGATVYFTPDGVGSIVELKYLNTTAHVTEYSIIVTSMNGNISTISGKTIPADGEINWSTLSYPNTDINKLTLSVNGTVCSESKGSFNGDVLQVGVRCDFILPISLTQFASQVNQPVMVMTPFVSPTPMDFSVVPDVGFMVNSNGNYDEPLDMVSSVPGVVGVSIGGGPNAFYPENLNLKMIWTVDPSLNLTSVKIKVVTTKSVTMVLIEFADWTYYPIPSTEDPPFRLSSFAPDEHKTLILTVNDQDCATAAITSMPFKVTLVCYGVK